jgi:hypothetical protein
MVGKSKYYKWFLKLCSLDNYKFTESKTLKLYINHHMLSTKYTIEYSNTLTP